LLLLASTATAADPYRVESNVVYGMYSGTALLMDVCKSATPKGVEAHGPIPYEVAGGDSANR
jgi:hypothetical protein